LIRALIEKENSEISLPEISLPEISLPEISLPEISLPEISLPEISPPEISPPEISPPEISPVPRKLVELKTNRGGENPFLLGGRRQKAFATATEKLGQIKEKFPDYDSTMAKKDFGYNSRAKVRQPRGDRKPKRIARTKRQKISILFIYLSNQIAILEKEISKPQDNYSSMALKQTNALLNIDLSMKTVEKWTREIGPILEGCDNNYRLSLSKTRASLNPDLDNYEKEQIVKIYGRHFANFFATFRKLLVCEISQTF